MTNPGPTRSLSGPKNDTNKAQTDIYKQAIADFQALYPNITVNLRLYTDYGDIYNDVITNISTGTTPNVCITYPDHIATYLTGDQVVVPLDELFDDAEYGLGGSQVRFASPKRSGIVPPVSGGMPHRGTALRRSFHALHGKLLYQPDLCGGAGLHGAGCADLGFYLGSGRMAAAKKNEDGTYALNGQEVLIPFIYKSTDNMMIQMLRQLDAGYSTGAGQVELFNDTTKEILFEIAEHTGSGAFSTFKISGYPANFLKRRAVRIRHRLHRRRHLDGQRRASGGHRRGSPGGF